MSTSGASTMWLLTCNRNLVKDLTETYKTVLTCFLVSLFALFAIRRDTLHPKSMKFRTGSLWISAAQTSKSCAHGLFVMPVQVLNVYFNIFDTVLVGLRKSDNCCWTLLNVCRYCIVSAHIAHTFDMHTMLAFSSRTQVLPLCSVIVAFCGSSTAYLSHFFPNFVVLYLLTNS